MTKPITDDDASHGAGPGPGGPGAAAALARQPGGHWPQWHETGTVTKFPAFQQT